MNLRIFFNILILIGICGIFFISYTRVEAAVLLPGNINSCGEIAAPGTYIITQNISGGSNTCFIISSDNVVIQGSGFIISGTGDVAIDARVRTGGWNGPLVEGAHAYTNLVLNDLNISGYTTGLNISGNSDLIGSGQNNGNGGDAGDVAIYYSYIGSIVANGGNTSVKSYGGTGGNISFNDTNLNLSNSTINAIGGDGLSGKGSHGSLDLNYTGTLTKTNTIFSTFLYLNDNSNEYANYPGGSLPIITNTSVSSCGVLYATTTVTFSLSQNLIASGTCFTIFGDNITIEGNGHTITQTSSSTDFAIQAVENNYNNLTISNLDFVGYSNTINSDLNLTVKSDNSLDLSGERINATQLTIQTVGSFLYNQTTVSNLSSLILNGKNFGSVSTGLLSSIVDVVQEPIFEQLRWVHVSSSNDGEKLVATNMTDDSMNGSIYTSVDGGATWLKRENVTVGNWSSIELSASGNKIVAVASDVDHVVYSNDNGATWGQYSNLSGSDLRFVSLSGDGNKIVALDWYGSNVYVSTDGGLNWITRTFPAEQFWTAAKYSSDGSKLVVASDNGSIFTSSDDGDNWVEYQSSQNWRGVDISDDGTKIIAIANANYIYISNDGGQSWADIINAGERFWSDVSISGDGTKYVAVVDGEYIFTSDDGFQNYSEINSLGAKAWSGVDSNYDGTKIIVAATNESNLMYISEDGGTTWVQKGVVSQYLNYGPWVQRQGSGLRNWLGVGSSADGSTLIAFVQNGYIYTSSDKGATWATSTSAGSRDWRGVTVSSDGMKMSAVNYSGYVYTSIDGGTTWIERQTAGLRNWVNISASSDGMKIAAIVSGGFIYTSIDGGTTWIERRSIGSGNWGKIRYSLSGNKLIVLNNDNGKIFSSIDDGNTWVEIRGVGSTSHLSLSSDGEKIAIAESGYVHVSIDGGDNWITRNNINNFNGIYDISISADGSLLTVVFADGKIYTSDDFGEDWLIDETFYLSGDYISRLATSYDGNLTLGADMSSGYLYTRSINTNTTKIIPINIQSSDIISTWNPYVIWVNAAACYYSYDNWLSTSTINCLLNGSDIVAPISQGLHTLYLKALGFASVVEKNIEFNYTLSGIKINSPILGADYQNDNWNPSVDYDVSDSKNLTSCLYSYNNFVNSTTTNCSLNGSDILPPTVQGSSTLYIKSVDSENNEYTKSVSFNYYFPLIEYSSLGSKNWLNVSISSNGNKVAAVVVSGYIYTSTDSGLTWTERTGAGSRNWGGISSSADGETIVAVAGGNYIYTSTNGGLSWTNRPAAGIRTWNGVDMTSNGSTIIASAQNGYLYISSDGGTTWATSTNAGSRYWRSVAVSADGGKYVAAVSGGYIYTSSDGINWATSTSAGLRGWQSVSVSDDGLKIAAVVYPGYLYISSDGGSTWNVDSGIISESKYWKSVSVSGDGNKIVATVENGYIHESFDGGTTWFQNVYAGLKNWGSIAISSDASKYITLIYNGYVYVKNNGQDRLSLTINSPTPHSFIPYSAWSPNVDWSLATNCYYSYNNWVSTSTVDCSLNGSDILPPSISGSSTLSVKATDSNGNISSNSVIFNYIGNSELWSAITSDTRSWKAIASSADGTKLIAAVYPGYLYTSNDSGLSWTQRTSAGSRNWYSVAASADGSKMAAVVASGGYIYISSDYGATWATSTNAGSRDWRSLTMSTDGSVINATVYNGNIYTSTTTGSTWVARTNAGARYWNYIAGSADGSRLIAVVQSGYLYLSTDGGLNWTQKTTLGTKNWSLAASSFDGSVLAAAVSNEYIYTSTDGGANWSTRTSTGTKNWGSLTLSSDGQKILANVNSGYIYTSSNYGSSWSEITSAGSRYWRASESSYDGRIGYAGVNGQYLYKNILNYAVSIENIYPLSSTTISTWTPYVYWSSANSCSYSYNNFVNETAANCSSSGSDIAPPEQSGTYTLYTKGIDSQNNTDITSSTFTIQSKYFCGTADSDWGNLSNWYTNNTCTTPSASLPSSSTPMVELIGSVSPIIESGDALPWVINTNGLTGAASSTGVIFSGTSINTKRVVGNATFRDFAYNLGIITGNAIFENGSLGTFTLSNSMKLSGTIIGDILGGDFTPITNLIFNDSSSNEIEFTGTATFNGVSNNNGTIHGDAAFLGSNFVIGNVTGTATLTGVVQIISGINNVFNFVKHLTSVRDTLYIDTNAIFNVSGLFTVLGFDQNNLLTIRSTKPGTYADLGINGTANMNYLRIRDIRNTGSTVDLSLKSVFNDGHTSGFVFPVNSSVGTRGGITGEYVTPSIPPSRNGGNTDSGNEEGNNSDGGLLKNIIKSGTIRPLEFSQLPDFDILNQIDPQVIGATIIPNPLQNLQAPGLFNLVNLPTNFLKNISRFLFSPIPNTIEDALKKAPQLQSIMASVGISKEQNLAALATNPIVLQTPISDETTPLGLFVIYSGESSIRTYLSYDESVGGLAQLVKTYPNQSLTIMIKPLSLGNITAMYLGEHLEFNQYGVYQTQSIQTPSQGGRYILKTNSSPLPLLIEVIEPSKTDIIKKENIFIRIWRWLTT